MKNDFNGIYVVPLIVGLTELAKSLGLPRKFAGLFSVALGITIALLPEDSFLLNSIVKGLVWGLSAAGLYSTAKSTWKGMDEQGSKVNTGAKCGKRSRN